MISILPFVNHHDTVVNLWVARLCLSRQQWRNTPLRPPQPTKSNAKRTVGMMGVVERRQEEKDGTHPDDDSLWILG